MSQQRPDLVRNRRLGLRLSLAALAAAGFLALGAPDQPARGDDVDLSVLLADGTLSHDNSRDGSAILNASSIWPGWSGEGDVTITNSGTAGSWLRLTEAAVDDLPGPGGGRLSNRLNLLVEDATVPGFPVPLYTGPLGEVGERWLGRMEPGEERTYRFSTSMSSQAGDNDYQSSAVSVRFEWAVSDTDPAAQPPPDDPPVDDPPVTDPPVDNPPVDNPPANDPPVDDPPVQFVPEGAPVVEVNRGKLKVKLAVPATQRKLSKRSFLTLVSCSRRCRATVGGRLAVVNSRAGGMRVAGVSRSLSAGIQRRVRLRISRKTLKRTMRLLAAGRSVRGQITLVARDRSGRVARATQRIRLVPAPR